MAADADQDVSLPPVISVLKTTHIKIGTDGCAMVRCRVKDNPITPQDVVATLYDYLGIVTDRHDLGHFGRPVKTLLPGRKLTQVM